MATPPISATSFALQIKSDARSGIGIDAVELEALKQHAGGKVTLSTLATVRTLVTNDATLTDPQRASCLKALGELEAFRKQKDTQDAIIVGVGGALFVVAAAALWVVFG